MYSVKRVDKYIYILIYSQKAKMFALTVKKQKLAINIHKKFALNVRKAYIVLASASKNIIKYIIFCYLETFFLC